jgi:hypothetical protein
MGVPESMSAVRHLLSTPEQVCPEEQAWQVPPASPVPQAAAVSLPEVRHSVLDAQHPEQFDAWHFGCTGVVDPQAASATTSNRVVIGLRSMETIRIMDCMLRTALSFAR